MKNIFKSIFLLGAVSALAGCSGSQAISFKEFQAGIASTYYSVVNASELPHKKLHFEFECNDYSDLDGLISSFSEAGTAELDVDKIAFKIDAKGTQIESGVTVQENATEVIIGAYYEDIGAVLAIEMNDIKIYGVVMTEDELKETADNLEIEVADYCKQLLLEGFMIFGDMFFVHSMEMYTMVDGTEKEFLGYGDGLTVNANYSKVGKNYRVERLSEYSYTSGGDFVLCFGSQELRATSDGFFFTEFEDISHMMEENPATPTSQRSYHETRYEARSSLKYKANVSLPDLTEYALFPISGLL